MIETGSLRIGRLKVVLNWDPETRTLSNPDYDAEAEKMVAIMTGTNLDVVPELLLCMNSELKSRSFQEIIKEIESILPVGKIPIEDRYERLKDLGASALSLIGRVSNEKMLTSVCGCDNTSSYTLDRIARQYSFSRSDVYRNISYSPNANGATLEYVIGKIYSGYTLAEVATHPNLNLKGANLLLKEKEQETSIKCALAENWNKETIIWDQLILMDEDIRRGLARNAHLTPEYILRLQADESPPVRAELAKKPNILKIIPALETDPSLMVRNNIFSNKTTDPQILNKYFKDKRFALHIASNSSTLPQALIYLSTSKNPDVRKSTLSNPSSPEEVAINLLNDPIPALRTQAQITMRERALNKSSTKLQEIEV